MITLKLCRTIAACAGGVAFSTIAAHAALPSTGYYRITPRSQPSMACDVYNMGNANSTKVQIDAWTNSASQQWRVEAESDGSYKIYAYDEMNSLQMLDNGGNTSNGGAVHTYEDLAVDGQSDTNQRWWFVDLGTGYYRLIPYAAGKTGTASLDITGGTSAGSGAALQIWASTGNTNQQFQFTPITNMVMLPNPKKGLPTGTTLLDKAATSLHASWAYNWSDTRGSSLASNIEYVPMVWGWSGDTNIGNEVMSANPSAKNVLGFNEPDEPNSAGGSNMTVATALQGFQYISALKSKGLGIISPACAIDSDSWMQSFMSQATASPYNYNIDYVGFHNYVSDSNATATQEVADLLGFVDYVHSLYNKPMWVTEFAPTNLTNAQAYIFVRLACQGLQSRSYVARYSMFSSEAPSSSGMGTSALVNSDGSLTNCGQVYARM